MSAARWAIDLLAASWALDIVGEDGLWRLRDAGTPIVYAIWHGSLLPALWRHRGEPTTLLVSSHRDGGQVARAACSWGYRVVRGSTTRGGARGLRGLVRALEQGGDVAVTPDGPRGPARVVKPGAIAAAQRAAAAVLPVATAAASAWRARSWDEFLVPRPFTHVRIVYGRPFTVAAGPAGLEAGRRQLQGALVHATELAECRL